MCGDEGRYLCMCMSQAKRFGLGLVQIDLIIEGEDKGGYFESALCSVYPGMYLCACLRVSGTLLDHVWL